MSHDAGQYPPHGPAAAGAEIRRMVTGDMAAVCELIGAAFADNPSTLANVRGDRARARRVMREAVRVAKFGHPWSSALVVVQGHEIVGALNAAQWPHCQLGIAQKIKTAPSMVRIWTTALPRAFTMMRRREAHDPGQAHWHIGPIGVRPDLQGHGIGKILLATFLATVDEQNLPAFLETDVDRNVTLYQKFGFTVTSREDIIGVDTRFMWRDSRAPANGDS
jgi:ribosomal protein S18 acetylase RimI-like enzyme